MKCSALQAATAALLLALALPALAETTPSMEDHPVGIHVHDVYARLSGGVGKTGAVFFVIHNNTETDDVLIGVSTDLAEKAELHTHQESADGVMMMSKIEGGIPLPAGEMHELARGGDHVMLMGLTRALKDGDTFSLTLDFQTAPDMVVDATVDNARSSGHDHMGHKGHMTHGAMSGMQE